MTHSTQSPRSATPRQDALTLKLTSYTSARCCSVSGHGNLRRPKDDKCIQCLELVDIKAHAKEAALTERLRLSALKWARAEVKREAARKVKQEAADKLKAEKLAVRVQAQAERDKAKRARLKAQRAAERSAEQAHQEAAQRGAQGTSGAQAATPLGQSMEPVMAPLGVPVGGPAGCPWD